MYFVVIVSPKHPIRDFVIISEVAVKIAELVPIPQLRFFDPAILIDRRLLPLLFPDRIFNPIGEAQRGQTFRVRVLFRSCRHSLGCQQIQIAFVDVPLASSIVEPDRLGNVSPFAKQLVEFVPGLQLPV